MARFNISKAKEGSLGVNRNKLSPGKHLCKVLAVREHSGFHGDRVLVDFEAVDGPSGAGFPFTTQFSPENAQAQGKMTREKAIANDYLKMQVALAAMYGYGERDADEVTQEVFDASLTPHKGPQTPSPLVGRLVIVDAIATVNKNGQDTVFYKYYPYDGEGQIPAGEPIRATQPVAAPTAPVAAPQLPPAPPGLPAGWERHPNDPSGQWAWNPTTGQQATISSLGG